MLTLRDLETYLIVKDYMEENDISIEELLESMNCKKVPITVTCGGVMKKFYSLRFAARYMGVSLPTVYYAHSKKSDTIVKRKDGMKAFYVSCDQSWNKVLKFYTLSKMVIKQEDLDVSKFTIEEVEGNENFKKA